MKIFMSIYGFLWYLAIPFLRKHKRLREGFTKRLVPKHWPYSSELGVRSMGESALSAGSISTPKAKFCTISDVSGVVSEALNATSGSVFDTGGASPPFVVWVQAASGGEARLVHALAKELDILIAEKKDTLAGQNMTLVCTTCTLQGLQVLQQLPLNLPQGLHIQTAYFPLDAPQIMRRALAQMRPKLLVLLETELWPGLLYACHEQNVPVIVLNGRMTEKSMQGYRWLRWFFRHVAPEQIWTIAQEDASRFAYVFDLPTGQRERSDKEHKGIKATEVVNSTRLDTSNLNTTSPQKAELHRVNVMPNIKFDLVEATAVRDRKVVDFDILQELPPLLALASTREQEETDLFAFISRMLQQNMQGVPIKIAIAPRHLHRLDAWEAFFTQKNISYIKRSHYPDLALCVAHAAPVLLWDTFGELDVLYTLVDAVFVGGSLAPLGGQNFLEPLGCGANVIIGPYISNFSWVGDSIIEKGLVTIAHDVHALEYIFMQKLEQGFGIASAGVLCNQKSCILTGVDTLYTKKAQRLENKRKNKTEFLQWLRPQIGGGAIAAKVIFLYLSK